MQAWSQVWSSTCQQAAVLSCSADQMLIVWSVVHFEQVGSSRSCVLAKWLWATNCFSLLIALQIAHSYPMRTWNSANRNHDVFWIWYDLWYNIKLCLRKCVWDFQILQTQSTTVADSADCDVYLFVSAKDGKRFSATRATARDAYWRLENLQIDLDKFTRWIKEGVRRAAEKYVTSQVTQFSGLVWSGDLHDFVSCHHCLNHIVIDTYCFKCSLQSRIYPYIDTRYV